MVTAAPIHDDYADLGRETWITRGDIAIIAGVQPGTVRNWAQTQSDWPHEERYQNLRVMKYGDAIDWLCKTGRLDCPPSGEMTREQVSEHLGISVHTLEKYRRQGGFPPPTRRQSMDRVPLWTLDVVEAWRKGARS